MYAQAANIDYIEYLEDDDADDLNLDDVLNPSNQIISSNVVPAQSIMEDTENANEIAIATQSIMEETEDANEI